MFASANVLSEGECASCDDSECKNNMKTVMTTKGHSKANYLGRKQSLWTRLCRRIGWICGELLEIYLANPIQPSYFCDELVSETVFLPITHSTLTVSVSFDCLPNEPCYAVSRQRSIAERWLISTFIFLLAPETSPRFNWNSSSKFLVNFLSLSPSEIALSRSGRASWAREPFSAQRERDGGKFSSSTSFSASQARW